VYSVGLKIFGSRVEVKVDMARRGGHVRGRDKTVWAARQLSTRMFGG
jgi:hypothetical protein